MSAIAYDVKQTHVVKALKHDAPLIACRFDPSGKLAFATSQDSSLQRWDLATGAKVGYAGHEGWVLALAFADAGKTVLTTASDGRLIWWSADDPKPTAKRTVQAHDGWARCVEVSPDGKQIATGGNDNLIKIWSAADGKLLQTLGGEQPSVQLNRVYSVAFHPGGKHLISGDLKGGVQVWDLATGKQSGAFDAKELHTYEGGQAVDFGGVRGLTMSPDRSRVACGGLYKASNPLGAVHEPLVVLFDWASRKKLRTQLAPGITGGVLWRLRYLPDQTLVGVCGGGSGGYLFFWKPDEEKDMHRFKLPNIARDVDLHPMEPFALTAHHDGNLRVCRLAAPEKK